MRERPTIDRMGDIDRCSLEAALAESYGHPAGAVVARVCDEAITEIQSQLGYTPEWAIRVLAVGIDIIKNDCEQKV